MTFDELYNSAYDHDLHHEPQKFINFFEQNQILIQGQKIESNDILFDKVTRLNCDYAHSLTIRENYSKAIDNIEKAIALIERHPVYNETNLFEVPYYEALIFDRASANYYLKNIKEAEKDLTELTRKFPGNDKYKNWKNATKVYDLNKTETFLIYFGTASLVANTFLESSSGFFWQLSNILLIAAIVGIGIIELSKWIIKKKMK
jgi:tetratricopeptide (TPR) repeat protein